MFAVSHSGWHGHDISNPGSSHCLGPGGPTCIEEGPRELDIHVGKDRNADESDVTNLACLQAIATRQGNLTARPIHSTPISISRQTMQGCQIDGYHVPAGTQVMVNIWKLQQDPRVWRSCPGFSFALHVVHLALAPVIHGSHAPVKMTWTQAMSLGSRNWGPIQVLFTPRLSTGLYE
ncbi:hypothetical protein AAC387_Pa04g2222 [Persea americana]